MELIQRKISPELDIQEKEIIIAKNGIRLQTIDNFEKEMLILIGKVHIQCGQIQDIGLINLSIKNLCEDLKKYCGTLTLEEITIAFKLGSLNEFGQWFGLNNTTYLNWCRNYLGWIKRIEANKKQSRYEQSQKNISVQLSLQEKDKIIFENVLKLFYEFKRTKHVFDAGNVAYNYLDNKKLIPFTRERKLEMIKMAMKNMREETNDKIALCLSQIERAALKNKLGTITPKDNKVRSEAKRIALNIFFTELLETDTELEELFT